MEAQSCDDEFDHATCVVAGVVARADTEIADATQQFVGIHAGENLARRGGSLEQLGATYPANVARWVTDELITTSGWGEAPLVLQP